MITSRHNQRLKDIRRLRRSKGELALLEGAHLVEEALAAGFLLEEVLATPAWLETPEGRRLTRHLPVPPLEVEPHLLEELTDADSPRGVLAVARLPRSGLEALSRDAVPDNGAWLYLDGLQDPGNLGALARVAEAAGAAGLALAPGSVHPNHPRALRASAGSLLRLPVAVGAEAEALDRYLEGRRRPARWLALVPRDGEDLWRAPLSSDGPLVLAIGAEGPGLSPALLARADLRLTISIEPPVESLNATVAAALVLFEIRRRGRR
jgi:TrmH family RNA methyltransferase